MNAIDIIIIVGVLIGFILGFKDGFIRKLIGVLGFALVIITAALFAGKLGSIIEAVFDIEFYLAEIIGGVVLFFGVILVFTLLKRIIHPFDRVNNIINQLVGGAVGIVQILFFLSAILLILNIFDLPDNSVKKSSAFYENTSELLPLTIDYLSNYTPDSKQIIEDYINEKDTVK
ncbi:MAG: CvpA family protein [Ignavibacteriae bacterium]|nr:MAG: CvpA family protein [Ignavibacteriota bacterium]